MRARWMGPRRRPVNRFAISPWNSISMPRQLLHLVFGGRVTDTRGHHFQDLDELHTVGIYLNYREAYNAWLGVSQATVDDAHMEYVVVHLHRMLEPQKEGKKKRKKKKE
jgi:hypothetical protein